MNTPEGTRKEKYMNKIEELTDYVFDADYHTFGRFNHKTLNRDLLINFNSGENDGVGEPYIEHLIYLDAMSAEEKNSIPIPFRGLKGLDEIGKEYTKDYYG